MAKRTHPIIPIANEMGYFPTAKQATEINCRAAWLYASHWEGSPPRGKPDEEIYQRTLKQAMEEVMSGKLKPR